MAGEPTYARSRTRTKIREADYQRMVVDFICAVAPSCFVFANPNASRRTASGRASNAIAGLTKGVADLTILFSGGVLFAELKAGKGSVSPEQFHFSQTVRGFGHHWACWRADDGDPLECVRLTFKTLNIPMREAAP